MSSKPLIIPFGKYRGEPAEVLLNDPDYLAWARTTDLAEKFNWFFERLDGLSRQDDFLAPIEVRRESSPMHNAIQARFLNREYCQCFAANLRGLAEREAACVGLYDDEFRVTFEENNIDVIFGHTIWIDQLITTRWVAKGNVEKRADEAATSSLGRRSFRGTAQATNERRHLAQRRKTYREDGLNVLFIELKPEVGDDYPSVYRTFKQQIDWLERHREHKKRKETERHQLNERRRQLGLQMLDGYECGWNTYMSAREDGAEIVFVIAFDKFTATTVSLDQVRKMFGDVRWVQLPPVKAPETPTP